MRICARKGIDSVALLAAGVAFAFLAAPGPAAADITRQAQVIRPPIAQYWMDLSTHTMNIPGMPDGMDLPLGLGGNSFGMAQSGMSPGRWLDTALASRNAPEGPRGTHAVPERSGLAPTLALEPFKATGARPAPEAQRAPDDIPNPPKARVLIYWGCGDAIRAGQPVILDTAKSSAMDFGKAMRGRAFPDRGAIRIPGRSTWPNDTDRRIVPKDASLVGEHRIAAEHSGGMNPPAAPGGALRAAPPSGIPEIRFTLNEVNDFLPALTLTAAGEPADIVRLSWQPLPNARGYFLQGMGARESSGDMILWSSSELREPGFGLLGYATPAMVSQLLRDKVALAPRADRCAIPKGVFAGADGAMVQMIAWGNELNIWYPPRPKDPKINWEPEWSVRARVKSTAMTLIGGGDE